MKRNNYRRKCIVCLKEIPKGRIRLYEPVTCCRKCSSIYNKIRRDIYNRIRSKIKKEELRGKK